MSPSASFSALGGAPDQETPRASAVNNPFDSANIGAPSPGLAKAASSLSLDPSAKRSQSPAPSGLRTPTSHGFMPLPLGTPGAGQPTTGVTVGDSVGSSGSIGFGLHEPPKMRKAMSKLTEDGRQQQEGGTSPTGISAATADTMQVDESTAAMSQNPSSTQAGGNSGAPRGTLAVKLISARGLAVSHEPAANPQPYVVITFEQNEFVSRPPHPVSSPASVPFTTAQAQPVTPGHLTRSSSGLGVSTITRAFAEAVGRGKSKDKDNSGAQTPRAEEPAGGGSWLGKPGPGDPIWKEEVSL